MGCKGANTAVKVCVCGKIIIIKKIKTTFTIILHPETGNRRFAQGIGLNQFKCCMRTGNKNVELAACPCSAQELK